MTKSNHPGPPFIADAYALDFINSIAAPSGLTIDWLANGNDLISWLEMAQMIPNDVAMRFRVEEHRTAVDKIANRACVLREWFRSYIALNAGKPRAIGATGDIALLNQILTRDRCFHRIEQNNGTTFRLQAHRRFDTPEDLLIPIAEAMAAFICNTNFERVKNCEGPTCTLWFHDVSKSHKRRWCDMSVCGNRAKAAAYRAKKHT